MPPNLYDAISSSPDPLNDLPIFQSPPKPRTAKSRLSLPLEGYSPTKQTFELDVGHQLSPQKIRVTVEAGNSDAENTYAHLSTSRIGSRSTFRSPVHRRRERTTTTTIPVKGLTDTEDDTQHIATPKRGRGRPRKSAGTPVPVKNRGHAINPSQISNGRRKSIGDLVDGDDDEDWDFQIGRNVEIGRGKTRSRSASRKATSKKSTPATKNAETLDNQVSSTSSKTGRGHRKTVLPDVVAVLEDDRSGENEQSDGVVQDEVEIVGALQPINANTIYPQSTSSTVRSTTTIGDELYVDNPDTIIVRFDPGNETPRRVGWFSPRIIDASEHHLSTLKSISGSSPSLSDEGTETSLLENKIEAMVLLQSPETLEHASPQISEPSDPSEKDHGPDDSEDDVGYLPEFDTILESEGFSMISVESVPSLQEHLSNPPGELQEQVSGKAKHIKNKKLLSVQGVDTADQDDSFSSIPQEVLEGATPGPKIQNLSLLSVQNAYVDDSFSSIPPEILQAATPARNSNLSRLLAAKNLPKEGSNSGNANKAIDFTTSARSLATSSSFAVQMRAQEAYEDSFSGVPSSILEAATPAPMRQTLSNHDDIGKADVVCNVPCIPDRRLSHLSSQQHISLSASARLLTPDDTPSPPDDVSNHQEAASNSKSFRSLSTRITTERNLRDESSLDMSQMKSSPPPLVPRRYTYTAHLRQQRQIHPNSILTPSIVFSSPSLPPPVHLTRGHPNQDVRSEQAERPTLSPIVRAGRVLQDIVVPSPLRTRAQSLGSPFKSPATDRKSAWSADPRSDRSPFQEKRAKPLPQIDLAGNLIVDQSQGNKWTNFDHQDDPFSTNTSTQLRSPSPEDKQAYSLELPDERRRQDLSNIKIRSDGDSPRSENDMSWQVNEVTPVDVAQPCSVKHLNSPIEARASLREREASLPSAGNSAELWEQKWAAERAAVSRKIAGANASQVIVIDSDDDIHSDEVARQDTQDSSPEQFDDDENLRLLLETLNSSSPAAQIPEECRQSANGEKPRRSRIPSPWRRNESMFNYANELSHLSSPLQATNVFLTKEYTRESKSRPLAVRRSVPLQQNSGDVEDADLSQWHIPQKSNFKPRARDAGNLDLSALLASSPAKILPVLSMRPQGRQHGHGTRFSNTPGTPQVDKKDDDGHFNTMACTSQEMALTSIPQKLDFKPRVREGGDNNMSEKLASSPLKQPPVLKGNFSEQSNTTLLNKTVCGVSLSATKPLAASSSAKINLMPAREEHSLQSWPSTGSNDSFGDSLASYVDDENQKVDSHTLKLTGSVNLTTAQTKAYASPTKSCLRSPLKTPSVGSGNYTSPSKTVAFVSSSPSVSPIEENLSATTWSRSHWLLLDSILQRWKPDNQITGGSERRRNSTRVISKLLGKNVHAQGEKMKLEQWHLEAVDEFRDCVPGWNEAVIAKRVFALIVGEERRESGLVGGGYHKHLDERLED